jgi:hypothetical protein
MPAPAIDEQTDWIDYTPEAPTYVLDMWEAGDGLQSVDLTRDEFVALKRHLAEMRGIAPRSIGREAAEEPLEESSADALEEKIEWLRKSEAQDFAVSLNIARILWRRCRKWVEARQMPDRFAAALREAGGTPDGGSVSGDEVLEPDYEEAFPQRAAEFLRQCAGKPRSEPPEEAQAIAELHRLIQNLQELYRLRCNEFSRQITGGTQH